MQFDRASYPPYINRKAIDSKSFAATDALQYIFALGAAGSAVAGAGNAEEGVRAVVGGLERQQREVLAVALAAGVDVGALAQKALRQVQRKLPKIATAAPAAEAAAAGGPVVEPTLRSGDGSGGGSGGEGASSGVCPLGYAPMPGSTRGLMQTSWGKVLAACGESSDGAADAGGGGGLVCAVDAGLLALARASLRA